MRKNTFVLRFRSVSLVRVSGSPEAFTKLTTVRQRVGFNSVTASRKECFLQNPRHSLCLVLLLLFSIFSQPLFGQRKTDRAVQPSAELQAIIEQLGSPDPKTQAGAVEKLKAQRNKRFALPALHAFLAAHRDDASDEEQKGKEITLMGVAQNLVSIGDASSLPPLQELLAREKNELSKVFLAWGTASLGDPSGTAILLARMKDTGAPNQFSTAKALREAAALACKDLIDRGRLKPTALVEVASQASHDSKATRAWLTNLNLDALNMAELEAALYRKEQEEPLIDAYAEIEMRSLLALATKNGVPALVAALRSSDPDLVHLRYAIVIALGESKDDRAVSPLIDVLRSSSDDAELKSKVKEVLQSITGQDYGDDAGAWAKWWETRVKK